MPESVSTVDAILDGLRDRSHLEDIRGHGHERVVYIDQAVAAVHAAAGLGSPDERLREALAGLLAADEAAAAGNPDLLFPAFDAARAALAAADREAPDEGCEPKETTDA